jgi:hypothetical protein
MTYKTARVRTNLIQKEIENSIAHKLTQCVDVKEKRELVLTKNPNHYIFGEERRVWKDYLTYEENMEGYKS